MSKITTEDRERFHELLDYALDTQQDYVIMQFAIMDLDFHLHRIFYRLKFGKKDDTISQNQQNQA